MELNNLEYQDPANDISQPITDKMACYSAFISKHKAYQQNNVLSVAKKMRNLHKIKKYLQTTTLEQSPLSQRLDNH